MFFNVLLLLFIIILMLFLISLMVVFHSLLLQCEFNILQRFDFAELIRIKPYLQFF